MKIKTLHGTLEAEVYKNKNPKTAKIILQALPLEGKANIWGNEIYFKVPVSLREENSQQDVEVGDIAYWPPGKAICIFFGKTPASIDDKPKAYSPVNVFGKITSKVEILKKVKNGERIRIEKV